MAARRRGAQVVTIDVRGTEAAAQSDETLVIRPGADAALALGMMHVIVRERLYDAEFVARNTVGFDALAGMSKQHSPPSGRPTSPVSRPSGSSPLRARYATMKPAMIVLGGSSMHKGGNGWQGARAVDVFPRSPATSVCRAAASARVTAALAHGQALRQ